MTVGVTVKMCNGKTVTRAHEASRFHATILSLVGPASRNARRPFLERDATGAQQKIVQLLDLSGSLLQFHSHQSPTAAAAIVGKIS